MFTQEQPPRTRHKNNPRAIAPRRPAAVPKARCPCSSRRTRSQRSCAPRERASTPWLSVACCPAGSTKDERRRRGGPDDDGQSSPVQTVETQSLGSGYLRQSAERVG